MAGTAGACSGVVRVAPVLLLCVTVADASARENDGLDPVEIEIPVLILQLPKDGGDTEQTDIDLANVVQVAAKGVTTVQEAPAIVTVVTEREIESLGHRNLEEIVDTVPGWMRLSAIHNQFPYLLTRGVTQSTLYVHNGISMFDPMFNVPSVGRVVPVEIIKRVEIVTGPGGVLWGANSFLGILNVITKSAEDVDGVEVGVSLGDGDGDRSLFRGYVMAGDTDLFTDNVRVFAHASFESFIGPRLQMPQHVLSTPLPQPNSKILWGAMVDSQQGRSMLFNFDGKLELGDDVAMLWSLPVVQHQLPLTFPGGVIRQDLPEDDLVDPVTGELMCPEVEPFLPNGQPNPDAMESNDPCHDQARLWRKNVRNQADRYLALEFNTRTDSGNVGMTARAYAVEFLRDFAAFSAFAPSALLEGGLGFEFDATSYRSGVTIDADISFDGKLRVLYGGEAFREWFPDRTTLSRGGAGSEALFNGPLDLNRLPINCPREPDPDNTAATRFVSRCPLTIITATDRTVLGGYVNPQLRLTKQLSVDGGVRVQGAPSALGDASYDPQVVFSGAVVYQFVRNWHAKLNYAEGFRPPVFNNIASNGETVQIDGNRDLDVERSRSIQAEVNARVLRDTDTFREVNLRADYSYTRLDDLIQIVGGRYDSTGARGVHSAELLTKLYFHGGHRLDLAYTWLRVDMDDIGVNRAMPEHWFSLGTVFNLLPETLQATMSLRVSGAFEDPNRIVEHRNLDPMDMNVNVSVEPHELVLDRIPPSAELAAGLTWLASDGWRLGLNAYNAFNTRHYFPDAFHNYEPRIEFLPNPYQDVRVVADVQFTH